MRLREFTHGPTNTPESNLVTALELLRNRYKDVPSPATISTKSLINLVLNTDKTFDYDALVAANESNPAVQNLIKSFNREQVVLAPFGDEDQTVDNTTTNVGDDAVDHPVIDVSGMAKRAAKQRGAAL